MTYIPPKGPSNSILINDNGEIAGTDALAWDNANDRLILNNNVGFEYAAALRLGIVGTSGQDATVSTAGIMLRNNGVLYDGGWLVPAGDDLVSVLDFAQSGSPLFTIGPPGSSYTGLESISGALHIRLGDDSGHANVVASGFLDPSQTYGLDGTDGDGYFNIGHTVGLIVGEIAGGENPAVGEIALKMQASPNGANQNGWGTIYAGTDDKLYYWPYEGSAIDLTATGTPAGSDTQIQYNNGGAFGASANFYYNGTTLFVTKGSTGSNNVLLSSPLGQTTYYPQLAFYGGFSDIGSSVLGTTNGGLSFYMRSGTRTSQPVNAEFRLQSSTAGNARAVFEFGGTEIMRLRDSGELWLTEIASGDTPDSGFGGFYVKTDGKPYFKNDSGTEYDLTAVTAPLNLVNATGGADPSNYLNVQGSIVDNSNYPGIRFTGGTLATGAYPSVTLSNGGLLIRMNSGKPTGGDQATVTLGGGTSGASYLQFSTAATERMQIAGDGNVGINNTTPLTNLDVGGRIRSTASGTSPSSGTGIEIFHNGSIGSILSFNRGTSSYQQLNIDGSTVNLRGSGGNKITVTSAGVGFFGTTPTGQSAAYTPTNVSTDRSYDADATTVAELADVLGTLIADLQATGLIG